MNTLEASEWVVVATGEGCEEGQIISSGLSEQEANDYACDLEYSRQCPDLEYSVMTAEHAAELGIE